MEDNKKRKRYRVRIEPDLTKNVVKAAVALVDKPAIELDYVAFAKETSKFAFKAAPDQRMIAGPVMVPGMSIYRNKKDSEGNVIEEYDVYFEKVDVVNFAKHLMKNSSPNATNVMHSNEKAPSFILESWFVRDPANDNSSKWGYKDLAEGTLFQVQFVEDEQFWIEYQKSGKLKGFSIEAYADLALSHIQTQTETNMNKISILEYDMSKLTKREFASAVTKDGLTIQTKDPNSKFEVDTDMVAVDDAGNTYDIPDGDYNLEDGTVLSIAGGKITNVAAPVAEAADPAATPADAKPADAKPATAAPAGDWQAALDAMKAEIVTALTDLSDRVTALEGHEAANPDAAEGDMAMKAEIEKLKTELSAMNETVLKFAKAPAATKPFNKEVSIPASTVVKATPAFEKPALKLKS